jgi:hypothetical protein
MLTYFGDRKTWNQITREERAFCAALYQHIKADPNAFVSILREELHLDLDPKAYWDAGYEVCFYRDMLHSRQAPKRASGFSLKRTFDLALFSERAIIVIEAKADQPFTADQAASFKADRSAIQKLLGREIPVHLVALASSTYFDAYKRFGSGPALEPFAGAHLTWKCVAEHYNRDPLLLRADDLYRPDPQRFAKADASDAPSSPAS